jgi:hypothetical protein
MRCDVSVGLSLTAAEVPLARDHCDGRLAAGLVEYLLAGFAAARAHLRIAFLEYQRAGNRRRGALAASHLGRVEHDGLGRISAANGWYSRARRLIASEPRCLEQGWVALGLVGCSWPTNSARWTWNARRWPTSCSLSWGMGAPRKA